jgi:hypothetical protein
MKETRALARKSRKYIKRLWRIRIDVTNFSASIHSLFMSIFTALFETVTQVASVSRAISKLTLNKVRFLPPLDLWFREVVKPQEDYIPTEMGRTNVSFLNKVNIARRTAARLSRRVIAKPPQLAFTPLPPLSLEAEILESSMETGTEEPFKTVPSIVADFQGRFELKLAPQIRSIASALQEYSNKTFPNLPFMALHKASLVGSSRVMAPPSDSLMAPAEEKTPQVRLNESPQVLSPQQKTAKLKSKPLEPIPIIKLNAESSKSFGYAIELRNIVSKLNIPILRGFTASSLVSPQKTILPNIEPTAPIIEPTVFSLTNSSQSDTLLGEVSSSLSSWIPNILKILRITTLRLSAIPSAVSNAKKTVMKTLVQPVSSVQMPLTSIAYELFPTSSKPATENERMEVKAFKLPFIVTSLIASLSKQYPLLFSEPYISQTWSSVNLTQVTPAEASLVDRQTDVKTISRLQSVIALAVTESLIAQKLQHKTSMSIKGIQVARLSYGGRLGEFGAFGFTGTPSLSNVAAVPTLFKRGKMPVPLVPSVPPRLSKPNPMSSSVQNNFNIKISADSTEQDLRDLERKINRILSEQMRRYYGSTRI